MYFSSDKLLILLLVYIFQIIIFHLLSSLLELFLHISASTIHPGNYPST